MKLNKFIDNCFAETNELRISIDNYLNYLNEITIEITEIAAPPFKEENRAKFIQKKFVGLGYKTKIDQIGNVLACKDFNSDKPYIIISAHLDTVFPFTEIKVVKDGEILKGPGVGDDSRGLGVLLLLAQIMRDIVTKHAILYVATVGEEGKGDLRGVKHLFNDAEHQRYRFPVYFLSIDGTGTSRVVSRGVGSIRYKILISGPGGHSYGAFGTVNPSYPLAAIIHKLQTYQVPTVPKTTFSIGRIGGGTSINAIPEEVWAEIDLRSESVEELEKIDTYLRDIVNEAVDRENNSRTGEVKVQLHLIGNRPPGNLRVNSPIVQILEIIHNRLNIDLNFEASSTDCNIPLSQSIDAIAIAGVESSGRAHSADEWINAGLLSLLPLKRNFILLYCLSNLPSESN